MTSYTLDTHDASRAWTLIEQAHRITLLAHRKPDGDALSSCAALSQLLTSLGKTVETVYPGGAPERVPFPPAPLHDNTHTFTPDLIISCDTANRARMYYPDKWQTIPLIVIDHHVRTEVTGTIAFTHPQASSTCELVALLFEAWQQTPTPTIANTLLFGILTDTQSFTTSNTTPRTLEIASNLIRHGANLYAMNQAVIQHTDPRIIALWGNLMANVIWDESKQFASIICPPDFLAKNNFSEKDLTGFINFFSSITTVDVSLLMYEQEDGTTKVSLRSKTTDVNAVANHFGGGGHVNAAGISSKTPLVELHAEVLKQLKQG